MPDRRNFDPYAILGVERAASALQVARAHRSLAKRHHPDLHPDELTDADERMRRINEAWQILSNPIRRADYDRAHPAAGTPASTSHWAASRHDVRPAAPTSTRTWATWRATAAETRSAPRTVREPGEVPIPRTRRPPRPAAEQPQGFLASGWAALLVAAILIVLVLLAAFARNLT
jgi:curved DNA-binding protein CbpA